MVSDIREFLVALLVATVALEAVTVNPSLCPTNKIAPHKRIASYGTGRTIGAFIDLLTPGDFNGPPYGPPNGPPYRPPNGPPYSPQNGPPNINDLQENPQEDESNDCGEIEDYDENDLSSITPQGNRRQDRQSNQASGTNSRWFGSLWSGNYPQRPPYPQRPINNSERPDNYPQRPPYYPERPPYYPERPPYYPERPPRPPSTDGPQRPPFLVSKPPYWSGGFFGSNGYRPPLPQNPSDSIKPIHEYSENNQMTYRPDIVGGPLGHVVGVSPIIPTVQDETTTARNIYDRYRTTTPRYTPSLPTRRPRARNMSNSSILGSFVDLLFK